MISHAVDWARTTGKATLAGLAFFGVAGAGALIWLARAPVWVVALAVGLVLLVALEEGSFAAWDDRDTRLRGATDDAESLVEWLGAAKVAVREEGCEIGLVTAFRCVSAMWTRDSTIVRALEAQSSCVGDSRHAFGGALSALVAHGLIEEERHLQIVPPPPGISVSPLYAYHQIPEDYSFSEFRWTELGRRVARRLAESSR